MKSKKSQVSARVEFGLVVMVDQRHGTGTIASEHGDRVYFRVQDACRAVFDPNANTGRPVFESLENPRLPTSELLVAFVAGQRPGEKMAQAFRWCSLASWDKALAEYDEAKSVNIQPKIPVKATHGQTPKPRRTPKIGSMVPFPAQRSKASDPMAQLGQAMDEAQASKSRAS
ncbi:MAG: hypothetical protein Q8L64_06045 [bacterium]|nr:hypothetical protein [bacterium]